MIKRKKGLYNRAINSSQFITASGFNQITFKEYKQSLNDHEYKCLLELLTYLKLDVIIEFDQLIYNQTDWLGRGYFIVRVPFANGHLRWKVVAPEGLFKFVQLYAFGIFECKIDLDEILN